MTFDRHWLTALIGSLALAACAGPTTTTPQSAASSEAPQSPPYRPAATVLELMESVLGHSAEVYWESVAIVIDDNGINELFPESEEEWEEVWAAAIALAESGNLLMMPPRAIAEADWMQYSQALIDTGIAAAEAALAQDPEAVLAAGEQLYYACLDCHDRYVAP